MKKFKGGILIFIGAIFFSAKAIMIKIAYNYQIDALSLLTLRMVFSLPFFMVIPFFFKKETKEKIVNSDYIKLILLGLTGYYAASIFDFIGLQYITAGLERLILFIYPTIVVLMMLVFFKKPIGKREIIALLLTYLGVFVVFFNDLSLYQKSAITGALFIFGSAVTYAGYLVGSGRLLPRFGTIRFTSYAMIVSSVAVIIHFLILNPPELIFSFPAEIYYLGFAIAIFSTVIPTFMVSEGIRLIGAGKAAIIASIGPVTTITLEYFILKEPLTLIEVIGTILVLAGVLMVGANKKS